MNKLSVLLLLVVVFLIPSVALAEIIGLIMPDLGNPFFDYLVEHVNEEAEKLGVEVRIADAQYDAARQAAQIESFIAQGVDGLLMVPVDSFALVSVVNRATDAGIPVATIDRKVEGAFVHVGADNIEGGRVAARYLIKKLGGKGNVLELEGFPGSPVAVARKAGFDEVIREESKIKILVSQTAEFQRAMGYSVMENLLHAYKDFQGVFAANDEMILGAINAMEAYGVNWFEVVTIGYDATPDALTYIDEGKLNATIEKFPGRQARKGLQFLVDYIRTREEPPSKEVYITPVVVTERGEAERSSH